MFSQELWTGQFLHFTENFVLYRRLYYWVSNINQTYLQACTPSNPLWVDTICIRLIFAYTSLNIWFIFIVFQNTMTMKIWLWHIIMQLFMCFILILMTLLYDDVIWLYLPLIALIWPLQVRKVQISWDKLRDYKSYMTSHYVFLINLVITCLIYEKQPVEHWMTLIWPFNVIQGQIVSGKLKGHIWLTIKFTKFHTNFDPTMYRFWYISSHRSQRSKLDISDLKLTFWVIPHL